MMFGLDVPPVVTNASCEDGIAHAPTRERKEKARCFVCYRAGEDGDGCDHVVSYVSIVAWVPVSNRILALLSLQFGVVEIARFHDDVS